MKNKYLAVVDADSIIYKVAYVTEDDSESTAQDTLRAYIFNIHKAVRAKQYIFCLSDGESGRNEVAVTKPYKGQRKSEKPKHFAMLKQYFTEEYNPCIVEGYEADDVVIAICDIYRGDSILCGIDKDAKQFAGHHYNYDKDEFFTIGLKESQQHFFTQMVTGDTVDNIPGVPRGGIKAVEKLFAGNPDVPPAKLVWDFYKDKGLDYDYYLEQFTLLRMKRDIYYPYEDYFIDLSSQKNEGEFTFDSTGN